MNTIKSIAVNTASQMFSKIITMSVTILTLSFISRSLGSEGYGQFSLIMQFAAFFYIISDFGLNMIGAREALKNETATIRILLIVRFGISILLILGILLILPRLPYPGIIKTGIFLSLLTIITNSIITGLTVHFQIHQVYKLITVANIISSVGLLVYLMLIVVGKIPSNVLWFVAGYVVQGIILVFVTALLVGKSLPEYFGRVDTKLMKILLIQSMPIGIMFIFSQIHGKADLFLLSLMKLPDFMTQSREAMIGIYSFAYKIFEVLLVFSTFLMSSAYPLLLKKYQADNHQGYRMFKNILLFLGILSLVLFVAVFTNASFIVQLLGGSDFTESAGVLRILSIGLPIFFLSSACQWFILVTYHEKVLPWIYLVGAIITVFLNILLIPYWAYLASAVITWLVELFILIMMLLVIHKNYQKISVK